VVAAGAGEVSDSGFGAGFGAGGAGGAGGSGWISRSTRRVKAWVATWFVAPKVFDALITMP